MNALLRMTHGRGGTRLKRIVVAVPHCADPKGDPRSIDLLWLAIFLLIPLLVGRFAVPTAAPRETAIDTSRLLEKPPVVLEKPPIPVAKPIVREARRPEPVALRPAPPSETPPPPRPAEMAKTADRPRTAAQPPEEAYRPAIGRASAPRMEADQTFRPQLSRQRMPENDASQTVSPARFRREVMPARESNAAVSTITRTRSAALPEFQAGEGKAAPARFRREALPTLASNAAASTITRTRVVALPQFQAGAGIATPSRRLLVAQTTPVGEEESRPSASRRGRRLETADDGAAPRPVATRERGTSTGASDARGEASLGLARGVSLESLEICSSPGAEEDGIRAVLSAVGSRQSCSDAKGAFQFKGTQRISSFNLIIVPVKGRKPSNRCEELENAYRCLKAR